MAGPGGGGTGAGPPVPGSPAPPSARARKPRAPHGQPSGTRARVTTPLAIGFLWWEFVAATGDLFVYIYLVRQRGLAFEPSSHPARWLKRGDVTSGRVLQSWRVDHFFGGHKPWRGTARCRDYFAFLDEPSFVKTESSLWGTTCHSLSLAKAVCLRKNMSHGQCSWCRSRHQKSTCATWSPGVRRRQAGQFSDIGLAPLNVLSADVS